MIKSLSKLDKELIDQLFFDSWHKHDHIGWSSLYSLLEQNEKCLLFQDERSGSMLLGLESIHDNSFWIQSLYADNECEIEQAFSELLKALRGNEIEYLYAISMKKWVSDLLSQSGFTKIDEFVQLSRDHPKDACQSEADPNIDFRQMCLEDIPVVFSKCERAFAPLWKVTPDDLVKACNMADHTIIAESCGEICGYLMTTLDESCAHLMRIAVAPEHQKTGIARRLMQEMFSYYSGSGISEYSVNTTLNNKAAMRLYQNFGFSICSDKYPVFSKTIRKASQARQ